jgi:raffinose/stachyose/melibiose transport system permease protein
MHIFCKRWIKLLFLLPTLVFFIAYTVYPVVDTFRTTFQYARINTPVHYAGLDNYKALFQDEHLPTVLKNTVIVTMSELILLLPLSLLLGLLLNIDFRGVGFVKVITFTPYILSGVITTLVWFFVVDPGLGILNNFLKSINLKKLALIWIGGETLTPYTVAFLDSWKTIGFYSLLVLAGLKMIPREYYEAATMDGASRFRRTWFITIPLLKETLKVCVVYMIIYGIQTFQTVVVLTSGGPNYKSHVIATYIYWEQWGNPRNFGYGATVALIMFIAIMGLSIGFLSLTRRRVEN